MQISDKSTSRASAEAATVSRPRPAPKAVGAVAVATHSWCIRLSFCVRGFARENSFCWLYSPATACSGDDYAVHLRGGAAAAHSDGLHRFDLSQLFDASVDLGFDSLFESFI